MENLEGTGVNCSTGWSLKSGRWNSLSRSYTFRKNAYKNRTLYWFLTRVVYLSSCGVEKQVILICMRQILSRYLIFKLEVWFFCERKSLRLRNDPPFGPNCFGVFVIIREIDSRRQITHQSLKTQTLATWKSGMAILWISNVPVFRKIYRSLLVTFQTGVSTQWCTEFISISIRVQS